MSQGKRMVDSLFLKNFLRLVVQFFSGKQQLLTARSLRKKVVSMYLPVGIELILAADAIPIFLCRIGDYSQQFFLRTARMYQNLFGLDVLSSGMRLFRPLLGSHFFSDIIDNFLTSLYDTYEKYVKIAEDDGAPLDACFGTRLLLGATLPQLKRIDGTLGYGIRCNWFAKVFEEIQEKSPMIFLEVPNVITNYAEDMMRESLQQVMAQVEQITGNTITNEKLRKQIVLINEIRHNYLRILELASADRIRISPLTLANLLSLLHIGFTDCLTDPKYLNQTLRQFVNDLENIPKNEGYDATNLPKLLLVNAFGGYEPHLPEIVDQLGGRLFVADWAVFKMLEPIEIQGDIFQNYAKCLLKFESVWVDNTSLVKRYLEVASQFKIDAIIFNNMYGCKSISPSLILFKEHLQNANLPLVDIGFQNIGDSYEQLKTRIGAVLEMIHGKK